MVDDINIIQGKYSALDVANWYIIKSNEEGSPMSLLPLIRMVYISHGWYLGNKDIPLIAEAVEAWKYGPIISVVYHSAKHWRHDGIESPLVNMFWEEVKERGLPSERFDEYTNRFLGKMWDEYRDSRDMAYLTKHHDNPWYDIWYERGGKDKMGAVIPNSLIRDYYKKKVIKIRSER